MLKKPIVLCYNRLLLGQSYSAWPPPPPCPHTFSACTFRLYGTAYGGDSEKHISWPSSSSFTPYDVFGQDRASPYSKSRFYELVKIYHPDRPCSGHPLCRNITPEARLQRYHIVVAAHEILSNPSRRAAYDRFGTGWHVHATDNQHPTPSWTRTGSSDYGPIYSNATWEDWERWYNRDAPKQENIVDQRTFITFIILLVLLGGAVQASWLSQFTTGYQNKLQEVNEKSARFLTERRKSTVNQTGTSEAKVQHFLIRRDPSGYGLKEDEQSVYRNALSSRSTSEAEEETTSKDGQCKEPQGPEHTARLG